ncbi:replicative DNA helicase [Methylobacterium sp. BE186]|uniref:replicative DNA helicase n=1 Tax=Methylobacterium sp. BE186 TaxID=2817715 RepID=UPI00285D0FC3|nr:replicative DNA helicase [Methylobacterium sp. BE186]MDR7040512.1 replicative DNA helicase [Methylobacterium sp. BE186]
MTVHPRPDEFVPPNAVEAEQALLGAILHNNDALDRARDHVRPEDFFEDMHRHIYQVMCQRRDAGEAIDLGLMKAVLGNADLGGLSVGGYLARLLSGAVTISGAPDYARLIAQAAQMRRVLDTAQSAVALMTAGSVHSPSEFAAQMIEALDEVAAAGLSESARRVTLGQGVASVLARVDQTRLGKGARGVTYGLPRLDAATLGMRPGQLIVLAGRPGMGKTSVAIHIGIAASRAVSAVGVVSLEMNAEELSERVLSAVAYDHREVEEISYRAIAEARGLSEEAMARLRAAEQVCSGIPLWIEQQPGLTLAQIAARARQMKLRAERQGIPFAALIIDHIGLIRPSRRYAGNRVQEMTEISGALKGLAKELGIPVLALSQLNRGVEQRPDKRPILSDLRESGSIEQDADVVLGLFREAYYLEHKVDRSDVETDRLARCRNILEIEILKQRSGPTLRLDCFCNIACNILAELA